MKEPNVSLLSQDAVVLLPTGREATIDDLAEQINKALELVRSDLQHLASSKERRKTLPFTSGTSRSVVEQPGIVRVYAISDTASTSDSSNYYIVSLRVNGVAPISLTYDTRNTEIPAYLGGAYLGEITVSRGDVIAINLATTGSPSPSLSTSNLSLLYLIREN